MTPCSLIGCLLLTHGSWIKATSGSNFENENYTVKKKIAHKRRPLIKCCADIQSPCRMEP